MSIKMAALYGCKGSYEKLDKTLNGYLTKLEAVRAAAERVVELSKHVWTNGDDSLSVLKFDGSIEDLETTLKALEGEKHGKEKS